MAVPHPAQASTCFSLNPLDAVDLVPENFLGTAALPTHAALRL